MTDYTATPKQWAEIEHWSDEYGYAPQTCILELRARVKTLEDAVYKHIVETNSNIVALFSRVESLEAAERPASKVHQISKPLKLTPEQAQGIKDLLAPEPRRNYPVKPDSSLVEQVKAVIELEDEKHYWPSPETTAADACRADMARAAIREVAAWMRENEVGYTAARWLEQEANQ
jgi:hypothetical protein